MQMIRSENTYSARQMYVEAMQINPVLTVGKGGFLSPHEVSHAQIAGWLLGKGLEFRVWGDKRPFGIEFLDANRKIVHAEAGDWIIVGYGGKLTKMTDDEFQRVYEKFDTPEADDA